MGDSKGRRIVCGKVWFLGVGRGISSRLEQYQTTIYTIDEKWPTSACTLQPCSTERKDHLTSIHVSLHLLVLSKLCAMQTTQQAA
jgi:hypothetical protein